MPLGFKSDLWATFIPSLSLGIYHIGNGSYITYNKKITRNNILLERGRNSIKFTKGNPSPTQFKGMPSQCKAITLLPIVGSGCLQGSYPMILESVDKGPRSSMKNWPQGGVPCGKWMRVRIQVCDFGKSLFPPQQLDPYIFFFLLLGTVNTHLGGWLNQGYNVQSRYIIAN